MEEPNQIETLRRELKLKPGQLAQKLQVSSGHCADLRSGRRKPSLPIAAKLDQLAGSSIFLPGALAHKMNGGAG